MRGFRGALSAMLVAFPLLGGAGRAEGQQPPRVDVSRFILDLDVPESPALVALGRAGVRVLRGSAPKPVSAGFGVGAADGAPGSAAGALDVSPAYLFGGGVRSLPSYRSNSLEGRVKRVLTKTILSVAAAREGGGAGATRWALGVRSTFHDPHDPVLNSDLPEEAAGLGAPERAAAAGAAPAARGGDLSALFAASRREMRGRCCVQVSAGWGMSAAPSADAAGGDGGGAPRHTLWVAAQFTLGPRLDVLTTAEGRDAFRPEAYGRVGAALQRKGSAADVRAELLYDGGARRVSPGAAAELRLLPRTAALLAVSSSPRPRGGAGGSALRLDALLRWYVAEPER
ncbi:MAG TPA: hypothetical protein VFQ38_06530 [Longimicrobiales bacterium]|nr:hypothetical protein [Longimicrobiales bacterium]